MAEHTADLTSNPVNLSERPASTEAPEFYAPYFDLVPAGDIRDVLDTHATRASTFLRSVADDRTLLRYAAGKWTVREVVSHINDLERVFTMRALWFARDLADPLPGFDHDIAIANAGANDRPWASHVDEFEAVRAASGSLFRSLPLEAWGRSGVANTREFSVRALAHFLVGHAEHHLKMLREQYGLGS